ncbi:glycosyltransferase family 2 protein [Sphingomonas jeddahensis]|uniref:Putative glycosyl transferase n=1 Tax=Sphingomonas jeddahensis TaxID=1915074 RepID=A0A1V2ERW3_9SPHN|nr:glycosyltransferase [Sphingomonas jeddahensis]ONF95402.1 putative glycosyl transferase [Sphingomonas jeddahensis]
MVEISVIIPHYDDLARLDRCLAALSKQTVTRDRYEIIVADNMSPAGEGAVRAVIAGRARLVFALEKGAGPARNAAAAAASGGLLAFTDADCVPDPTWLAAGLSALVRQDMVGGRITVLCERAGMKSGAEAFETVFAFNNRRYIEQEGFSVTANLFCRRDVYDATGPFRVGVSEDRDWCLRARALGFRLAYQQAAVVGHPARADWPSLMRKWRRLHAELFANALMRRGGRLRWLVASAAMPASILAHLPRILVSPALAGHRERALGAATLARLRLWRFADGLMRLVGARA